MRDVSVRRDLIGRDMGRRSRRLPCGDMETEDLAATIESRDESDDEAVVEDELLVEEISIDGMCGVY